MANETERPPESVRNGARPAYAKPDTYHPNGSVEWGSDGLTKRELFAAMAMQGFIANKERPQYFKPIDDAAYCVKLADALLAALQENSNGR